MSVYDKLLPADLSEADCEELQLYKEITKQRECNSILFVKILFIVLLCCFVMGALYIASFDYLKSLEDEARRMSQGNNSTQLGTDYIKKVAQKTIIRFTVADQC